MLILKIFLALLVLVTVGFSILRANLNRIKNSDKENYGYGHDETEELEKILKLQPKVYGVLAIAFCVFGVFSSIYFTGEQDIGFTSTFGQTSMIEGAGLHFKIPFLSEKHIYDATTKGMAIGYVEETNESEEVDSLMITSDFNFVNIDFYIEYRISDPIAYCYGTNDPEGVLENITQSAIRNTIGQFNVDSVITTGKSEIEIKVYDDIVNELESHNTGFTLVSVMIQDSEPPTEEVSKAFTDVENEKQNATSVENSAYQYQNTQIPAAEAEAEEIKNAAEAAKTERVNAAKEEVANFEALYTEYQANPDTVKTRLYYEALEEVLPNMEIIIGDGETKVIYVKGESAVVSNNQTEEE